MEEKPYTSEERTWALFAHLSIFSSIVIPFGNIIGPLIVWLAKKNESEFVERHGRESLNFQISVFIYSIIFVVAFLVALLSNISILESIEGEDPFEILSVVGRFLVWLVPIIFLGILNLIVVIIASIKASNGQDYRYPLCIRFVN